MNLGKKKLFIDIREYEDHHSCHMKTSYYMLSK
jgi:hypothetical protein